ncbi:glycosyltransferase family 1 protein [soil metagenome]
MQQNELVVLSHLRWDFVWQRPQQLISRLAKRTTRTFFVEEPFIAETVSEPALAERDFESITRLRLELPGVARHCDFGDPAAASDADLLVQRLGWSADRLVGLYTPMALPLADLLEPTLVAYDVMDDLASFSGASPELRARQRELLARADVVFAGGRSLLRSVRDARPDAHLFASGVDPAHFEAARQRRRQRRTPVAGYVGVIDERLDLELVAGLATALPDWEIQLVGPVAKIDPASLPQAPNVVYSGSKPYARLPEVMSGFDVALMPFAINEATRSISPTKTLEYIAAGLPVVSTPVPDVVTDFSELVDLQDDGAGFAAACRGVLDHDLHDRDRLAKPMLHWNHWDAIASRMGELLDAAAEDAIGLRREEPA